MKFKVIKTPFYPCQWKCESIQWPGHDNSTHLYHRTKEEAQKQVDKYNVIYKDNY